MNISPAASLDDVLALYQRWGQDAYDEELSQLDHGLQTAALARRDGATPDLIAAALLHDVGHLLQLDRGVAHDPQGPDLHHEAVGARYLSSLFGPDVTRPIALHVRAKRFRCTVDPDYRDALSPASERSLALQGGVLDAAQVQAFRSSAGAEYALRLRAWDDHGKVPDLDVPTLDSYRALLVPLVATP